MRLTNGSYMDMVLPCELEIGAIEDDEQTYLIKLENFYLLNEETRQWHKMVDYPDRVYLVSKNEIKDYDLDQRRAYINQLKRYYDFYSEPKNRGKIIRLSDKKENKLNDEAYRLYLKELRLHDDKSKISTMSISGRKILHPLLRVLMKASRASSGIKVVKLNKKLPKGLEGRPIIFVLTHVGKDDIAVFNEAIGKHYTILSGDYESLHNNVEGLVSGLNGTLFFDMQSREERRNVINRVEDKLNRDYILCSMEAAWNISANEPVCDLFDGMIQAAINKDAVIVTVGIERFNKKLYGLNVGDKLFDPRDYSKNYDLSDEKSRSEMLKVAKEDLRQKMADEKLIIYFDPRVEKRITDSRSSIGDYDEYNKWFISDILSDWSFTETTIEGKKFRRKDKPQYAFEYLVKRYSILYDYIDYLNDKCLSDAERVAVYNRFRKLLDMLHEEVKYGGYPNSVHLALEELYNDVIRLQLECEEKNNKRIVYQK